MKKIRIILSAIWVLLKDPAMAFSFIKNIFIIVRRLVISGSSPDKYIFVCLTEHLGDIIAAEPVAAYLKDNYPSGKLIWVIHKDYAGLIISNPLVHGLLKVTCFTEWILLKKMTGEKNVFDLHIDKKICTKHHFEYRHTNACGIDIENYLQKGNLLYAFSRSANLDVKDTNPPVLHLNLKETGMADKKYIVFHGAANSISKSLSKNCCTRIAAAILESARDIYLVETGFRKSIFLQNDRLIDYTGKRDLEDIAGLIKDSQLFIGIDSGFAHIANALKKNSLIFIGHLGHFEKYMPYSGFFRENRDGIISYYNGPLIEMDPEEAAARVKARLIQPR